jgi:hypothetical protein
MVPRSDGADGGRLGRGWVPSPQVRATVLVVVGLLFVLNPLVGGLPDAVGLGEETEYAAAELAPAGGDLSLSWVEARERSVRGVLAVSGGPTLLDCYPGLVDSEACALESTLVDEPVGVEEVPPGWGGYTYHGRLYERTATGPAGNVTLGLRPVAARAVLANVSAPLDRAPDPVARAVAAGSVSADPPLRSTGLVLERDGSYYLVLPLDGEGREEPPGPVYTAASTALGVVLVQRGRRVAGA